MLERLQIETENYNSWKFLNYLNKRWIWNKRGKVSKICKYSYDSFIDAINLANKNRVDAICRLPINKESWSKADIKYKGHTEVF